MIEYRAHLLNHANYIFGIRHFEAGHDQAAIDHAAQVFRSGIGKGYEIWQDGRLVHAETYGGPSAQQPQQPGGVRGG